MSKGLIWVVCALAGFALARDGFDDWVARTQMPPLVPEVGVEVRARDGALLRAFQVSDGRWRLTAGAVDPAYVSMLLAYEDKRFYRHAGVDLRAALRAAFQAVWRGEVVSGGSTLTMQVARLLEDGPTGSLRGKLRQTRLALALERRLSKAQILELYLTLAPFGGNIEGVRAASLAWFGREPARLTPAQSALLVALPQAPESRRPDRHPQAATAARARVLRLLVARGALERGPAEAALREAMPRARRPVPAYAPLLAERLRAQNPALRVIETTIDLPLQRAAETLARQAVRGLPEQTSAALILADHQSGEILAHVGAADWTSDQRRGYTDMTRALRSPGSTLKPFIYALAFDQGLAHPQSRIADAPRAFGTWRPQNFDRSFRGEVSVSEALRLSLNLPVVSLLEALGPARLVAALSRTGMRLRTEGPVGLAVALGGAGVTLEDLAQGYAALARLGAPVDLRVRPAAPQFGRRIVGEVAAWQVVDILSKVTPPDGSSAGRIAYKTGTSYGHRDALALGFDGRLLGAVWLGRPDGTPVPGAFGGDLAAPVLFELLSRAGAATPLPPAPRATLMVENAALPQPLQRFLPAEERFTAKAPELTFPPAGAQIESADGGVTVKLRGGHPPFTWLADGRPLARAVRARQTRLTLPKGPVTLSVIDATGASARVTVEMR